MSLRCRIFAHREKKFPSTSPMTRIIDERERAPLSSRPSTKKDVDSQAFFPLHSISQKEAEEDDGDPVGADEVLSFPTNCPECNAPAETNMKVTRKYFFLFFVDMNHVDILKEMSVRNTEPGITGGLCVPLLFFPSPPLSSLLYSLFPSLLKAENAAQFSSIPLLLFPPPPRRW